ncbi:MAG: cobalamin biosynthesis bifunctional protein CbiET, partial [Pseudonocardiales bacterium]
MLGVPRLPVIVVGLGADGWAGLGPRATEALRAAEVVLGSERQLSLLAAEVSATRRSWPTPLLPALPGILDEHRERRVAVLASGDPMFFGIGSSLV